MLIKGVILSGFVYEKLEPKPYTIYENGRKTEGYSYSLVVDLLQQDSACPTIKCSEEVYHSVKEYGRYAFLCTVDTDASNSSNRFKLTGFASDKILGKNDWFSVVNLPVEQSIMNAAIHGMNPFKEVKEENLRKFEEYIRQQENAAQGTAQPAPAPATNADMTGTNQNTGTVQPAQPQPVQPENNGFTQAGTIPPEQGEPAGRAETDKQPTKTKK